MQTFHIEKIQNRLQLFAVCILLLMTGCQGNADGKQGSSADSNRENADITDVEEGIRAYIDRKTAEGEGFFHLKDDSFDLKLMLVRVHTEYLSILGPNRYFACVDLADNTGDVYDVDFFLSGKPGDMNVTETTVHKLNGKPYYTWKQREDKSWHRVSVEGASNELLGVIEGEDKFEFRYIAQLPEITGAAKMWIPVAGNDPFQVVTSSVNFTDIKMEFIEDSEHGNTILYLEPGPQHSGRKVEIVYQVHRQEKGPYEAELINQEKYLSAERLIPVGGRFREIVEEALEGKEDESQLMKARALYDYIIDNMRYAKQGKYGTGDADYACDSKSGNCTEFHSLFLSLARTAGIPARFAIGAAIPSERNEGGVNGYHCWAEFYADGKWWPVDISEGNKYTALATYYFGHHPANRIELSRGRDLQLNPGPISGPVVFLAYPILEVGGTEKPVKTTFTFSRKASI